MYGKLGVCHCLCNVCIFGWKNCWYGWFGCRGTAGVWFGGEVGTKIGSDWRMADQVLEGSQPVDLSKHPSGIIPTLQ